MTSVRHREGTLYNEPCILERVASSQLALFIAPSKHTNIASTEPTEA